METKGIIISQKEYERLTELEKNFDDKVKKNKESFKKGLEDAIKGNLVKLLWIKDKCYADIMGCDLSEEGICKFISKEDADMLALYSKVSKVSYDRDNVLKDNEELYQEVIADQRKTIRYLWWAFAIMSMTWLVQLIAYAMK